MRLDLAKIDAAVIEHAPPAAPRRPLSQLISATIYGAVATMGFLTLIGIYLAARHTTLAAGDTWIPDGGIPLTGPNTALFTLLLSIPAMAWAQHAIRNNDRQSVWVAFGIVLLLGAAFINALSFVLRNVDVAGNGEFTTAIADSVPLMLIFTIVGVQILLTAAGMVAVLITVFRALGGRMGSHDRDAVDGVALYWYVTVALFGVLWYAVLVMK